MSGVQHAIVELERESCGLPQASDDGGWRVISKSDMVDNIFADGYLRSEDLHDEHSIQQRMDAMNAVDLKTKNKQLLTKSFSQLLRGRW